VAKRKTKKRFRVILWVLAIVTIVAYLVFYTSQTQYALELDREISRKKSQVSVLEQKRTQLGEKKPSMGEIQKKAEEELGMIKPVQKPLPDPRDW